MAARFDRVRPARVDETALSHRLQQPVEVPVLAETERHSRAWDDQPAIRRFSEPLAMNLLRAELRFPVRAHRSERRVFGHSCASPGPYVEMELEKTIVLIPRSRQKPVTFVAPATFVSKYSASGWPGVRWTAARL